MKTPYILEGSNVFIGGDFTDSVFKKKLPHAVPSHILIINCNNNNNNNNNNNKLAICDSEF